MGRCFFHLVIRTTATEPNLLQLLHFATLCSGKAAVRDGRQLTLEFITDFCNCYQFPSCSRITKRKMEYFTLLHWWIYSFIPWTRKDAVKFLKTIQRIRNNQKSASGVLHRSLHLCNCNHQAERKNISLSGMKDLLKHISE